MKSSYPKILLGLNRQELTSIMGNKPTKSSLLSYTMTVLEKGLAHFMYTEPESKDRVYTPNLVHKSPLHTNDRAADAEFTPKT